MSFILVLLIVGATTGYIMGRIMNSNRSLLFNGILGILGGFILQTIVVLSFYNSGGIITFFMTSAIGAITILYIERLQYKKIGKLSFIHNYLSPFTLILFVIINVLVISLFRELEELTMPIGRFILDYYLGSFVITLILFYMFIKNESLRQKAIFISGVIPLVLVYLYNVFYLIIDLLF